MDERLKKFVQLVDSGSYTQASRQLHISQPALSVAIGKLERELHASLLVPVEDAAEGAADVEDLNVDEALVEAGLVARYAPS